MAIKRHWWIGFPALLLFLIGVSWIAVHAQQARDQAVPHRARESGQPIPVRSTKVVEESIRLTIGATAVTEPSRTAAIWVGPGIGLRDARVRIKAVHVTEGEFVRKGQLLFALDDELFAQAVRRQRMALAAAISERESVLQLRRERAATGLQLRRAELNVELAKFDLQVAESDLRRCQVQTPLEGFVDRVNAVLGEEVDASREFTQVHQLNPIHVRVDFPQERLNEVYINQPATVVLDSDPQQTHGACVVHISPQADPERRVLPVILKIQNNDHRIRAGLTAYARLAVDRRVASVPMTAVSHRGTKAMVFCVEEGQAMIREVQTGAPVGIGRVEIRSGLKAGDTVVVHGSEFLRDRDVVNVDWKDWARRN